MAKIFFGEKTFCIDSDSFRKGYKITDSLRTKLNHIFSENGEQKIGEEYRKALKSFFNSKNRCDNPITMDEIFEGVTLKEMQGKYRQYKDFLPACRLFPKPYKSVNDMLLNGNLCIEEIYDESLLKKKCVVYLLVEPQSNIILKVGRTDENFIDRLGTYGNGRLHLRLNGTGTTTNYWITQSAFCNNIKYDVYILPTEERPNFECTWYDQKIGTNLSAISAMEARAKETVAIELYKKMQLLGLPPVFNVQSGKK